MSETNKPPPNPLRHAAAVGLVVAGVLILAGIVAFVWITMGFGYSFANTVRPAEDLILGFAVLTPFILFALILIGYGRRLLRKE